MWIYCAGVLVLLLLGYFAIALNNHYKYDVLICILLLSGLFHVRRHIQLTKLHFLLATLFLVSHCIGVFDLYKSSPMGLEYDYWIHAFFGVVCSLILMNLLELRVPLSINKRICITVTTVMGFAAFHELYEFAGAVLLGEGEGVLFIGAGDLDQWDTQKDILNNLIGALAGSFAHVVAWRVSGNKHNLSQA